MSSPIFKRLVLKETHQKARKKTPAFGLKVVVFFLGYIFIYIYKKTPQKPGASEKKDGRKEWEAEWLSVKTLRLKNKNRGGGWEQRMSGVLI